MFFSDRQQKDAKLRATIDARLTESGEKERLKEELRAKLIECGWRDNLKTYCKGSLPLITMVCCS